MTERLVVIGGDAAGMSAASQARKRRGTDDLQIAVFERGRFTSYSACGIPYWIAGVVESRDALVAVSPEQFRERGIEVHRRREVVAIDTRARRVEVWELDGGASRWESYDELLIATGARPIRPSLPGLDTEGVFGVQTLGDGAAVRAFIEDNAIEQAVVVGGGYIGLEMAEAMAVRGIHVHVVSRSDHVMPTLDADIAGPIADAMRAAGIEVHLGCSVDGFEVGPDGRVAAVRTDDGHLDADLVFLGIGAGPEIALAEEAGLPIGAARGIVTDARQHTPVDGVWAAGDCTQTFHRVSREPVAISLGTIANKQGRVAGMNLGGDPTTFPGVLGTAITRVCDLEVARTGLSVRECNELGQPFIEESFGSTTAAGYMPEAHDMRVKVTVAPDTHRLLGAQIVGGAGAAKRIDAFAMALWNEMTVEDLVNVDLSYAPPFSGVWDAVLVAARKVVEGGR